LFEFYHCVNRIISVKELVLNIELRPAGDADTEFLYHLYASTRADEMAQVDWTQQQIDDFLRMQFNAQHSYYHEHFSNAQFDIIESDEAHNNESIGRLYVDRRADEIRIIDIALLPDFRGKGIGEALMQSLLDEASASNKAVSIHVEHNNAAMHLYKRLGFRHIRDEGVYYFMRWDAEQVDADGAGTDQTGTAQAKTAS